MGKRISQLDLATPLTGAEQFVLVQNSRTKRVALTTIREDVDTSCQCTLVSRYVQIGNAANTLEQFIHTYQMPANTLASPGYWLEIYASGEFANNTDAKLVSIYFDTTSFVSNTGGGGTDCQNKGWEFWVRILMQTTNVQMMTGKFATYGRTGHVASLGTIFPKGNPAANLASVVPIKLSVQDGTGTANNILVNDFIIRVNKMDADS